MYSTCLFCAGPLGRNEAIEQFPVGRRLAFDASKGRLWVVCPSCSRWNLTPLETRWEAIEEAERAFLDAKQRAVTDNIGLAKLKEGTELVRIGQPQLPEFAAWRYGRIFRQRFVKGQLLFWGGFAAQLTHQGVQLMANRSIGPAFLASPVVGVGATALVLAGVAYSVRQRYRQRTVIRDDRGNWLRMHAVHVSKSRILADTARSEWSLRLRHVRDSPASAGADNPRMTPHDDHRHTVLRGDDAIRALAKFLPVVNREGSVAPVVKMSVDLVTEHRDLRPLLAGVPPAGQRPMVRNGENPLSSVSPVLLLALEMSLHEADELRALEGELRELEARWREAEEIAAIADGMFLPTDIGERLHRLRAP